MRIARAYRTADANAKPGDVMRFLASTTNIARDGMIIESDAWELDNYRKNPVFLFCHDYYSRLPIGQVVSLTPKEDGLYVDVVFDQADEFARQVENKYLSGFMNAVSVGWDTLNYEPGTKDNPARVTKADLLDISAVPIPSDPDALKMRQSRALNDLAQILVDEAGVTPPANTPPAAQPPEPTTTATSRTSEKPLTWLEAAEAMVRLFSPFSNQAEDVRAAEYRSLASVYARHGKTAPELLSMEAVDLLAGDNIAGLFFEGEPELFARAFSVMGSRAGAVLSARNLSDLEQAASLILGVVSRAKEEADSKEEERALRALAEALKR